MNRLFKESVIVILLFGTTIYLPSCKKEATPPEVKATKVSDITKTSASVEGTVTDDGGTEIMDFGICWSTSLNPTTSSNKTNDVSGSATFIGSITGLTAKTRYYVRAYATNSVGTSYSNQISFETALFNEGSTIPTLTTAEPASITSVSAVSGGTITNDGGEDIIDKGIMLSMIPDQYDWDWDYDEDVTIFRNGPGSGSFADFLSGLTPGTTYFVKAFAVNAVGTAFGSTLRFTTDFGEPEPDLTYGSVSDIDGNDYKTIQIGTQEWMAENLKTTKYNDGNSIPNVPDIIDWSNLTTGAYCWYNNDDDAYKAAYGALYNWFAVNTDKLCPTNWHIPSDEEWTVLLTFLGGESIAGGKLMETGTSHWLQPDSKATNITGFTGLPGGFRYTDDGFGHADYPFDALGFWGFWWSASEYSNMDAWIFYISSYDSRVTTIIKNGGMSVRCVKD